MERVDWLVVNEITRSRRRSLVHIRGYYGNTLCGVPIPQRSWDANFQPLELTCFRCKASFDKHGGTS